MQQYLDLLRQVYYTGDSKGDRTGTGTRSLFGLQFQHDMRTGFPLLTTKKLHIKSIVHELLWFLRGDTNIKYLHDNGVRIWDEWADANGDVGAIYGKQWRRLEGKLKTYSHCDVPAGVPDDRIIPLPGGVGVQERIDQIAEVIAILKRDPFSRRMVVNAWNVAELNDMNLTCCHALFQLNCASIDIVQRVKHANARSTYIGRDKFGVAIRNASSQEAIEIHQQLDDLNVPKYYLDLQMYQRSADIFLGVPFNIASYGLLLSVIAKLVNMAPRNLITSYGDLHLYNNHFEQAEEQLSRTPRALPTLTIGDITSIDDLKFEDFTFHDYNAHPSIKAPVAV